GVPNESRAIAFRPPRRLVGSLQQLLVEYHLNSFHCGVYSIVYSTSPYSAISETGALCAVRCVGTCNRANLHHAVIPTGADHPETDGPRSGGTLRFHCFYVYLLGSYRIATAPEPNSRRLTSRKSIRFDSPANSVGPWPASLGCTTNSYSSINPSSANACGSFTPPTNSPLPDSRLSCSTACPRSPRPRSAFQSTRSRALDTTSFFAAPIVGAKGSIQSGLAPVRAGGRHAASIISYVTRPKRRASARARFSTA